MKRYIVLIANIKDGKPSVNCFLFEIQNGKQIPVEKGCFDVLYGDSPFRLNSFVMENVRNGAESLNDKDKVCKPADEMSRQDENKFRQTPEADKRNPGESGLSIILNIGKKEIDESGRENKNTEIDDHVRQNSTRNMIKNNNKSETEHRLKKSNTRTKLPNTRRPDGTFTFNISSNEVEKSPTSPSEQQQESKVNSTSAESDHEEGNHPDTEKVSTGQPRSSNDRSDPQYTTTTNGEEKEPTSTIEEPQELKVNDTPAESVHEGGNDPESEDAISGQPKSADHHSDPQETTTCTTTNGEENSQISPSEEQQESKVNNASAESVHEEGNHPETEEVSTRQPRSSNDRIAITGQPKASNHSSSDPQHTTTTTTTNEEENEEQTKEAKCTNLFCCEDTPAESVHKGKNDPGSEECHHWTAQTITVIHNTSPLSMWKKRKTRQKKLKL